MLSQKEKSIAQYLFQHRNQFVTSKELAGQVACSDRTVRTYLKSLSESFKTLEGVSLFSKQGYGYQLQVSDEEEFFSLVGEDLVKVGQKNTDITDRHYYIINKLIFEQKDILLDDLADQLFVSRSTLSSDVKKIRRILSDYHLNINSRANRGIFVEGAEHHKRRFIMDYFFSGHFMKNFQNYISEEILNLPISFEELTIVVLDECRNGKLSLSDFVIQNLVIHIALALKRVMDGFQMTPIYLDQEKFAHELMIAKHIVHRLERMTGIIFPKEEADYIALHLISKGKYSTKERYLDIEQSLRSDLMLALERCDERYGLAFSRDFTLIEGLLTHMEVLAERLKNKIQLKNPLLEEVRSLYQEPFELTKELVDQIVFFKDYHLSDDELAYMTLHLMAALERYKEDKKVNVLVICATGYGSAQMLKHRLLNELSRQVHVVDVVGYYDINDDLLTGVDLIISSIDLSTLVFSIPVVTVSVFLKSEDVLAIKQVLSTLSGSTSRPIISKANQLASIFDQYFSPNYFQVFEKTDKAGVLNALVDCFNEQEEVSYKYHLLDLMIQREKMSSVVFDQDIAVPHPLKAFDKQHKIGVAIIKNGIDWDEQFHHIKLVFLVSPSVHDNDGLSDLTQLLVRLTERSDIKEKMIHSQSYEEFKQLFLSII